MVEYKVTKVADTTNSGLCPALDDDDSHFLDGQGNWSEPAGGMSELKDDTTPQLGGNLDCDGKFINSVTDADGIIYSEKFGVIDTEGEGAGWYLQVRYEEITIPVGQGSAGVSSATNLLPGTGVIMGCQSIISQAPGGGATTVYVEPSGDPGHRMLGATPQSTDLNTRMYSSNPTSGEDTRYGPWWNHTGAYKVKVYTDTDVTGTDMKIKIAVFQTQAEAF